ncbi:hypothetical protein LCGC14_1133440 [marine sediment metagenome]|uniref:Uncharacterized protein n=1 Tax=marine sediment metagenome TaxID=412755 RepID=A0A0F9PIP6_9ZZZZ
MEGWIGKTEVEIGADEEGLYFEAGSREAAWAFIGILSMGPEAAIAYLETRIVTYEEVEVKMTDTEVKEPEGPATNPDAREIPFEEWKKEGEKLFGDDPLKWKFVCPNCGHVQTMQDFVELHRLKIYKGKSPEVAYFSCIGRFDTRIPRIKIGTLGEPKEYCDYTLGGLIPLVRTVLITQGDKQNVFEFAAAEGTEGKTE